MEDLLETCAAMEEEFIYLSALSRLEYFKNGIQFDKRIVEKRRQLMGSREGVEEEEEEEEVRSDSRRAELACARASRLKFIAAHAFNY